MADWNVELPADAVEGMETHVEDHNAVYGALREIRANVDNIGDHAPAWGDVTGKPEVFPSDDHKHDATDVSSGTFAAGRIPTLGLSKVSGLSDRLDAIEARLDALDSDEG